MPKGTRKCKICGCEYEYCRTMITDTGIFRWQDVACCQEHGAQYFQRVLEARGELPAAKSADAADGANSAPAEENAPKRKTRKKKTVQAEPTGDKEMA